jgi:hypothetical protein
MEETHLILLFALTEMVIVLLQIIVLVILDTQVNFVNSFNALVMIQAILESALVTVAVLVLSNVNVQTDMLATTANKQSVMTSQLVIQEFVITVMVPVLHQTTVHVFLDIPQEETALSQSVILRIEPM